MTSISWRGVVLALGAVLVVSACDSNTEGTPTTSAPPSVAADVPAGFDPCTDIPQSVLDSEQLRQKINDDSDAAGGVKWRGCLWAKTDSYAVSIRTTNITVEMVESKGFPDTQQFVLDGRRVVTSRQSADRPEQSCTLDVELKGGSLEFGLSNPKSAKNTGNLDSCELVRSVAEAIIPTVPANA